MTTTAKQQIEEVKRQPAEFPHDGEITAIFEETVHVRPVGSQRIKRNVRIPSHIKKSELAIGYLVRLEQSQGKPILSDVFPYGDEGTNYAGVGTGIPDPPQITVTATKDGWLVEWQAVPGANKYQVWRNDDPDGTSPDEVGFTDQTSIVVPYESLFIYFAVCSVSGLNKSEASEWITHVSIPPTPSISVVGSIDYVTVSLSATDTSADHDILSHYIIERADNEAGTNTVIIDENVQPFKLPYDVTQTTRTVYYYRLIAVNYPGYQSEPSPWVKGTAYQNSVTIQDKFDLYGGDNISSVESLSWLKMSDFSETVVTDPTSVGPGTWKVEDPDTGQSVSTAFEGDKAVKATGTTSIAPKQWLITQFENDIDLSQDQRFTDDDYVTLLFKYTGDTPEQFNGLVFYFKDSSLADSGWGYAGHDVYDAGTGEGFLDVRVKRSNFGHVMDWANVRYLNLVAQFDYTPDYDLEDPGTWPVSIPGLECVYDDLRVSKADPNDSTRANDTGGVWNYAASSGSLKGIWRIYHGNRSGEPGKPYSLGQVHGAAAPSIWYLAHRDISQERVYNGTIQAGLYLKDNDGKGGLAFYVKDVTAESWDMYAVEADSSADTIKLVKWVNGTRTELGSANFSFAPGEILWLGADFRNYDSDNDPGRLKVFASLSEGHLIQASNLIISKVDTEIGSGGTVGLLSYESNVRFVDFSAGSPAHAEVADIAKSVQGPMINGAGNSILIEKDIIRYKAGGVDVGWDASTERRDSIARNIIFDPGVSPPNWNTASLQLQLPTGHSGRPSLALHRGGISAVTLFNENYGALDGLRLYEANGVNRSIPHHKPINCYKATNTNLPAGAWSAIPLDTYRQGSDNGYQGPYMSGGRIYARYEGWYQLVANFLIGAPSATLIQGAILFSGLGYIAVTGPTVETTLYTAIPAKCYALAGMYFEMHGYCGVAGGISYVAAAYGQHLSATYLGD